MTEAGRRFCSSQPGSFRGATVLAGSGPLLYLIATQFAAAGARIETSRHNAAGPLARALATRRISFRRPIWPRAGRCSASRELDHQGRERLAAIGEGKLGVRFYRRAIA